MQNPDWSMMFIEKSHSKLPESTGYSSSLVKNGFIPPVPWAPELPRMITLMLARRPCRRPWERSTRPPWKHHGAPTSFCKTPEKVGDSPKITNLYNLYNLTWFYPRKILGLGGVSPNFLGIPEALDGPGFCSQVISSGHGEWKLIDICSSEVGSCVIFQLSLS